MTRGTRGSLALTVVMLVGCSRPIVQSIEHPARLGRVPENEIVHRDRRTDAALRELPSGSMSDFVRLVRFDAVGVCFHYELVHPTAGPITIAPDAGATLSGAPHGQSTSDVRWATRGPERAIAHGSVQTETLTGRTRCDEYGCGDEVEYGTRQTTRQLFRTYALLCFPNGERFAPETEAIELQAPQGHFRWELRGTASSWPQPVITRAPAFVAATDELLGVAGAPTGAAQALLRYPDPTAIDAATASRPAAQAAPAAPSATEQLRARATGSFAIAPMTLVDERGRAVVTVQANGDIRDARYIVGRIQGGLLTWRGRPLFALDAAGELHSPVDEHSVAPAGRLTRDGMTTADQSVTVGGDGRLTVTQSGRRQRGALRFSRPTPPAAARGTAALVAVLAATLDR